MQTMVLTPYQQSVLLPTVARIARDTGRAARTKAVAARLGMAERTARLHLSETVKAGALQRVGVRGGWMVA